MDIEKHSKSFISKFHNMGETCSVCRACTDQQEIRTTNSVARVITKNKIFLEKPTEKKK